jgi:hypothetical protein
MRLSCNLRLQLGSVADYRFDQRGVHGGGKKMFLVHQPINITSENYVPGDTMAFEPTIQGIDASWLFEFEDECGKYYITNVGGMPEREHTFYYGDGKYEFCFYARQHWEGSEFDVEVYDATVRRFYGPSPRIDPQDFDRISRNMARFFAVRWFLSARRPIPSTEKFRSLKLSWVLR